MPAHSERTIPVIAGVGQVVQRPDASVPDAVGPLGPIELMVEAAFLAGSDAGAPGLLHKVEWVGVTAGWFSHTNPGSLIAARIGVPDAATALFGISGSAPQDLVAVAADRIARGEIDVAVVVGGEARWSQQRLDRSGATATWTADPGRGVPETQEQYPAAMYEEMKVFRGAVAAYAVIEDSLRMARGESVDAHRDRIAGLWSTFAAVAAANPYAWDRSAPSAADIREATAESRMISFPYTKAMVANNTVDMGSAIIVCSLDAARSAGVTADRLVFPQVVTASREPWLLSRRPVLHSTQALAAAGAAAFGHAGIGADDLAHVDLYACFPSIVQMSAPALGIDLGRPLTLTGGLGFAGAPVGNAVGHSIAAMVEAVRSGGLGLVHGNGGAALKHSIGIYAPEPMVAFAYLDLADELVLDEVEAALPDHAGDVTIEAATVLFDRDGPQQTIAAVQTGDGRRGWATTSDEATMATAITDGLGGLTGYRTSDGELRVT